MNALKLYKFIKKTILNGTGEKMMLLFLSKLGS